ncbi:MAG: hypothetical protein ABIT47_04250 [Candidatus Paceibacterota bacterium]
MPANDYRAALKGAELLDEKVPGWMDRIDLRLFGPNNDYRKGVLTQLFGSKLEAYKFFGWDPMSDEAYVKAGEFGFSSTENPPIMACRRFILQTWFNLIKAREKNTAK